MTDAFKVVCGVIKGRQTTKIVGNPQQNIPIPPLLAERCDAVVRAAVDAAGWAPFHFARQADGLAEPWRVTILWHAACRQLAERFTSWFSDVKPGNKIPGMLAACGATLLITELPNSSLDIPDEKKLAQVNFEHTLAVGAMAQSLLLALTAAGLPTYWSSGGQLGSEILFERLSIPRDEKLAAAIFVGYDAPEDGHCERLSGGNRAKRRPASDWTREFPSLPQ